MKGVARRQSDMSVVPDVERARAGWWLYASALAVVVAWFVHAFVGTFVLGLFVYYAARPVHRRVLRGVEHRTLAATLTMLAIVLPAIAVVAYAGLVAVREFTLAAGPRLTAAVLSRFPTDPQSLAAVLERPVATLADGDLDALLRRMEAGVTTASAVATGILHLTLALAFTFFLLRDGERLEAWFRRQVGDEGTVAHTYLAGVDADLETVYFGHVVTVLLVIGLSVLVYNGYNAVVPAAVELPLPTLLALLTGLATFVPLVVGKLVYVPATAYLVWAAVRAGGDLLWAPAVLLVVSFVMLDVLPQTVLRPILSGRSLHTGIVLFAYVLGVAFFGWYGLFLGPLVAVLVVQFLKLVFPELLHGHALTPEPSDAIHIGHQPDVAEEARTGEAPDGDHDPAERSGPEADPGEFAGADDTVDDAGE